MNKGTLLSYPIKKFIRKYQDNKLAEKYTLINNSGISYMRIRYKFYQQNRLLGNLYEKKGFQIYTILDNIIFGVLEGPPNSLYKNGFFMFVLNLNVDLNSLEDRFLEEEKPLDINPFLIFRTKIFHPNIDEKNNIMNPEIFSVKSWKSVYKIITYIQSILVEPNKNFFFEKETAAKLYLKDKNEYEEKVKEYVSKYATYSLLQKSIKELDNKEKMKYYLQFNNLFN